MWSYSSVPLLLCFSGIGIFEVEGRDTKDASLCGVGNPGGFRVSLWFSQYFCNVGGSDYTIVSELVCLSVLDKG